MRSRGRLFLSAVLAPLIGIAIFSYSGNAQERQLPFPCPVISVSCPDSVLKTDKNIIFHATVNGGEPKITPTFYWSSSDGRITKGQGTNAVTVRIDGPCPITTATVEIGGFAAGCARTASCTTCIDCCGGLIPDARKIDEFGNINCEDEMAHLDMFALQLNNEPGSTGYVIFYGGRLYNRRLARRGEAEARAGRIKKYLVESRGIDAGRVVMVTGGYRNNWGAELWIAQAGSAPPTPTPTLKIKDIKFRRGKIGKREYN
jgi:hypothetical protein